jgi:hypothetical protein
MNWRENTEAPRRQTPLWRDAQVAILFGKASRKAAFATNEAEGALFTVRRDWSH